MKTYLVEILDTAGFEITRKFLVTDSKLKDLSPWIKTFCEFPFKFNGKNKYIVDDPINTVDIIFYESETYVNGTPKYTYEINYRTDYIGDKYVLLTDKGINELSECLHAISFDGEHKYIQENGMEVYVYPTELEAY